MMKHLLTATLAFFILTQCKHNSEEPETEESILAESELSRKYKFSPHAPDKLARLYFESRLENIKTFGKTKLDLVTREPLVTTSLSFKTTGPKILRTIPKSETFDHEDYSQKISIKKNSRRELKELRLDTQYIKSESAVGTGFFSRDRANYDYTRFTYTFESGELTKITYDVWEWRAGGIIWSHQYQAIFEANGDAESWTPEAGRKLLQLH
jgi:hypothetical protein